MIQPAVPLIVGIIVMVIARILGETDLKLAWQTFPLWRKNRIAAANIEADRLLAAVDEDLAIEMGWEKEFTFHTEPEERKKWEEHDALVATVGASEALRLAKEDQRRELERAERKRKVLVAEKQARVNRLLAPAPKLHLLKHFDENAESIIFDAMSQTYVTDTGVRITPEEIQRVRSGN